VGTRHPSPGGRDQARRMAQALVQAGWTVASGLALGIDAAAHEGALDAQSACWPESAASPSPAGASTIAVLGCGPDLAYPSQHQALAQRIAQHGLLISEHAPGSPPLAAHFPQRNRILAGLTRGTLVVEAALRSGSLITARLAAEAGREVFAIPGPVHAPHARGCHALIKQGAKLVEGVDDILDEFAPSPRRVGTRPVQDFSTSETAQVSRPAKASSGNANTSHAPHADSPDPDPVLAAIGQGRVSLDDLVNRTGWPVQALNARLLELELTLRVTRLPGGCYARRALG
jgi:DNA processing protein